MIMTNRTTLIAGVSLLIGIGAIMIAFSFALALGCGSLPHVTPQPRDLHQAAFATVQLDYSCGAADPFPGPSEFRRNPGVTFASHYETGTVISERYVLSALHAFDKPCPWIPSITAWVGDRPLRMYIERRDTDPDGLVRLEILSGSTFGLGVAPPQLGDGDAGAYVNPIRVASIHGTFTGDLTSLVDSLYPGDGGAGVYSPSGLFIGIVLGIDDYGRLHVKRVDSSWLEGT